VVVVVKVVGKRLVALTKRALALKAARARVV
jgi:hypothetical protein